MFHNPGSREYRAGAELITCWTEDLAACHRIFNKQNKQISSFQESRVFLGVDNSV